MRDDRIGVARPVDSLLSLVEVVVPVFGEVAVAVEGSEFEDRFGAGQSPAAAGDEVMRLSLPSNGGGFPYAA